MQAMIYRWGYAMAVIDLPIVGQSYHLEDWAVDCQRTINLYPQAVESGNAPQVSALIPTPGLIKKYELAGGAIRGMYALTDRVLIVAGNKLYTIDKIGAVLEIGAIAGVNRVTFADNSLHVMIVGAAAYKYTIANNTLTQISGEEFFGASDVTVLDSRLVWTVPKSGRIQWSGLLNTDTTALSYATAETKSDDLVRTIANGGQLWLIGEKSTEIWSSTGDANLPFQRMPGAFIPVGCVAKDSVCQFGQSLVWLSQSDAGRGQIVMTQGYQAQRISNHAIEYEIASYSRIDDAYSFAYQEHGHSFLLMTFPSAKKTWCFDSTTNMWHERSFYNTETNKHEQHRAASYCYFMNAHLVGDRLNSKVYQLTPNAQTDDGASILRERITPVVNPHGTRLIFSELELIAQVGQETGIDPQIILDWSDDRGKTWSHSQQQSLGKIGEYGKRVIFRRLGQSFGRVFRIRMSDPVRLVITGAKVKLR